MYQDLSNPFLYCTTKLKVTIDMLPEYIQGLAKDAQVSASGGTPDATSGGTQVAPKPKRKLAEAFA